MKRALPLTLPFLAALPACLSPREDPQARAARLLTPPVASFLESKGVAFSFYPPTWSRPNPDPMTTA